MPIITRCTDLGAACSRCGAPDTCWTVLDGGTLKAICGQCAAALATPQQMQGLKAMNAIMGKLVKEGGANARSS